MRSTASCAKSVPRSRRSRTATLQFSDTTAGALLRYERTSGDSRLVIVVNRGHQYAETKIDALYALDLLSGEGFAYADPDGLVVSVPPETAYILRCVNAAD